MKDNFNKEALLPRAARKTYELPQPEAPVSATEYLITEIDGHRCCFVKWTKNIKARIDSMTYEVVSLDIDGAELGVHSVCVSGELIPSGKVFSPNRAAQVYPQCHTVRIRICEVVAGAYTYIADGNKMRAEYSMPDKWVQDEKNAKKLSSKRKSRRAVYSKRGKNPRMLGVLTLIFAVLIIVLVLSPFLVRLLKIDWFREYFGYYK